jgi:hypothetical protein
MSSETSEVLQAPSSKPAALVDQGTDLKSLRDTVVDAAGVSAGLWISYLFVLVYLLIAVGGVTHRNLFFEDPVRLPFLNVDLPLVGFFVLGPALFGRQGWQRPERVAGTDLRRLDEFTVTPTAAEQHICTSPCWATGSARKLHWKDAATNRSDQPCDRSIDAARVFPVPISAVPSVVGNLFVVAQCRYPRPCFAVGPVAFNITR